MKRPRISALPMILIIGALYTYWNYARYVLVAIILLLWLKLIIKLAQKTFSIARNRHLRNVDTMNGTVFEHYIAGLLIKHGYTNVSLTEQYDYGVDVIAEKDGIRWGIQAKRYSSLVKAAAVRQVVTGLALYDCDRAMVITNSTFSAVARHLANGNGCVLIDRAGLCKLASSKGEDI